MAYTPITPFRRRMDAVLLEHEARAGRPAAGTSVNKWEVLRDLATAREGYGLSDRDLTVLQALLSFHPAQELDGAEALVVHPANRTICERLNGMPCSTMRRHLGKLVAAGILLRRDSPNGKRYARRYAGTKVAYGFDLSPLLHRAAEFAEAAETARAAEAHLRQLRETATLLRRDLAGLAAHGRDIAPEAANWDALLDKAQLAGRALRRKLSAEELGEMAADLEAALVVIREVLAPAGTEEMSTSDARNEQHHTEDKKKIFESEPRSVDEAETVVQDASGNRPDHPPPTVPLGMVRANCPEIASFTDGPIANWRDLVTVAETVRPMMGLSPIVWAEAVRVMGPLDAAIVVAAMLERFGEIRSPDAYLRALSIRAGAGQFSVRRMVVALERKMAA